ncbi:MAG TPA: rhomboid-like protein [Mycobacteriales bacterium]|nr:rhomboid-like protein [Mycobacteriales bacterium]
MVRAGWRRVLPLLRGTDLAWIYALVLLATTVGSEVTPGVDLDRVVLESSTNLDNLRQHPLYVLATSAFMLSSPWDLWILVPLLVAYGAAQRWVGRVATTVVAAIGHVGATLFVAVLLVAGLTHGRLDPSIAKVPDVGVSYGLVAIGGLLAVRVPRRLRLAYVGGLALWVLGPLLVVTRFSDVGHAVALMIGLGLAVLAARAGRAAQAAAAAREREPEPEPAAAAAPARRPDGRTAVAYGRAAAAPGGPVPPEAGSPDGRAQVEGEPAAQDGRASP